MTDDNDDALRQLARTLFDPPTPEGEPEPAITMSNTVPAEGGNSAAEISADDYGRDFVRRMFGDDYAASEPNLPEKD